MTRAEKLVSVAFLATFFLVAATMVAGFVSTFRCEECLRPLANALSTEEGGADGESPFATTKLTSATVPVVQESPIAVAPEHAPLDRSTADEPTTSTEVPPVRQSLRSENAGAAVPDMSPLASTDETAPGQPEAAPKAPPEESAASSASSETSTAEGEPEPGVLTDPPAGEVPEWKPIPSQSGGTYLLPILIVGAPIAPPRSRPGRP